MLHCQFSWIVGDRSLSATDALSIFLDCLIDSDLLYTGLLVIELISAIFL